MKTRIRRTIFYTLTIAILCISVAFSVFRFSAVLGRTAAGLKDCLLSLAYYVAFLFKQERYVTPTIGIFPDDIEAILPITLEQFEALMTTYGELLADFDVFLAYLDVVRDVIGRIAEWILPLTLLFAVGLLLLVLLYSEKENNVGQDSKALRFFKWLNGKTLAPLLFYTKKFWRFLKARKYLLYPIIGIWLYNLNVFTIAFEALAWLVYFVVSYDLEATLVFIAKFAADMTVSIFFLPRWVWAIILYKVFDFLRCRLGIKKIKAAIEKVKKFLQERREAKFILGFQRSKKTSLLVQLKTISECCVMRPQAKKAFLTRAKQFPKFPWLVYSRYLMTARKKHKIYNWACIRQFLLFLQWAQATDKLHGREIRRQINRHLRRRWGYTFDDYCFGYDLTKNATVFDDGLDLVSIYDAMEGYGKTFFLYSQETPLDISNFPIRSDFIIEDGGNMPEFKVNLTEKDTKKSMKRTKWGHRINRDCFRLGEKFDPTNPEVNAVEYGLKCSMEDAKERKNQITRRATKTEEGEPTQDNDLTEMEEKIHTHAATVDNFTYWDDFRDDHRAMSLNADSRDLKLMMYIEKSGAAKFYLPFFALDEAVFGLTTLFFDFLYWIITKKKGSNTALIAFLQKLYTPIFKHYTRYYNFFSYYPLEIILTTGASGDTERIKMPLIALVAYRGRFRTDALGAFFYQKTKMSLLGLDDIPMYQSKYMTVPEMVEQKSYMIRDMMKAFKGMVADKNASSAAA